MNNTPDNNNYRQNVQRDGQAHQTQQRRPAPSAQRTANPQNANPQARRPLNDEERRRLEAARMAAMQNGSRMTEEELRRRRMEQQRLNSAQPQANARTAPNRQQMNNQPQNRNAAPQPRRKKKRIKINVGAVIFVLLIAGVIGVSVHQIGKNEDNAANRTNDNAIELPDDAYQNEETGDIGGIVPDENVGAETDAVEVETTSEGTDGTEDNINLTLYDTTTVANTALDEGDLILVNYQYAYADTDTIALANVYNDRTSPIKVSSTDIRMTAEALTALDALHNALIAETGCDDLLIVSGHRTVAEQQSVYDGYLASDGQGYVDKYVADPTFSEHHTGLACDLSFFTDDGYSVPISDHEFGYWLGENCAKYGYVRRYPEDKVDITQISYEAWHFRYVGVPHAYAMTALDYCLEEYIDCMKTYTADTKLLHILSDGTVADVDVTGEIPTSGGWLVYYVPMAEGENTEVKLLRGDMYANYEISGNNVDGYIVTVTLP